MTYAELLTLGLRRCYRRPPIGQENSRTVLLPGPST